METELSEVRRREKEESAVLERVIQQVEKNLTTSNVRPSPAKCCALFSEMISLKKFSQMSNFQQHCCPQTDIVYNEALFEHFIIVQAFIKRQGCLQLISV